MIPRESIPPLSDTHENDGLPIEQRSIAAIEHFPKLLGELPWMFAVGIICEALCPVPNTAHLIGSDVVDAGTPKGLDSIKNGPVVEYIAVG